MRDPIDANPAAADLLADLAVLGPVRAVLRNCSGFVEVFCSTDDFRLTPGWLSLRSPTTHLHLQVPVLAGAALREAGEGAHPHHPSIWLVGRCGSPCLILIFDQTEGEARRRQGLLLDALRSRWGEEVVFRTAAEASATHMLH